MGLVDRHLRVLIAVQEKQGRVVGIDVEHRAAEARDLVFLADRAAEQELERRLADLDAARCR
jgi:hypothetical protein